MAYEIKSARKLFNIIETVQRSDEPTLATVADELDMPKSTTLNHLRTLVDNGYLVEENEHYRLSLKFLDHGIHVKRKLTIAGVARPILDQLADETKEAAWLIVEERGYAVGLEKSIGERGVQTAGRIGRHTRLHYHAPGKALLSQLPEERVDEIIDEHGLPAPTEKTITDPDELKAELAEAREQNVAFGVGEAIPGMRSVAAPVLSDGEVQGAVAVVGPGNRLRGDRFREELPALVSGAANELELRLEYDSY